MYLILYYLEQGIASFYMITTIQRLLFYLISLLYGILGKVIKFQYLSDKPQNDIRVKAALGTPFKEYVFAVDLSSQYTVLSINDHLLSSSSYHILDKEINQGHFKGLLSNDIFRLDDDTSIRALPFLSYPPIRSNSNNNSIAYLGFGRGDLSLLGNLFQSNLISKRIFQIEQDNIIIGSFNESISSHPLRSCSLVTEDSQKYICLLHKIDLSHLGKVDTGMAKAIFKSYQENISAPYSFWYVFKEKYFKQHLLQNQCKYHEGMYSITVKCVKSVQLILSNITLVFDNAELVLSPRDLFDYYNEDSNGFVGFRIEFIPDLTYWTIGTYLIKKYRMIFNNEDELLQFVTDDYYKDNKKMDRHSMGMNGNSICKMIIVLLISGIGINAFVFYNIKGKITAKVIGRYNHHGFNFNSNSKGIYRVI